jgi:PAS domain S-box-containing protein
LGASRAIGSNASMPGARTNASRVPTALTLGLAAQLHPNRAALINVSRLTLRFAVLTAAVALVLLALRWHSAAAQLGTLESVLAIGASTTARHAATHLDELTGSRERQALLDQWHGEDPRLHALQVMRGDGSVELSSLASRRFAQVLPPPDLRAGLRAVNPSRWLRMPGAYVLDHSMADDRVLRMVFDAEPLVDAWAAMVWPAVAMLLAMSVAVALLFRRLLAVPLESLREMAAFAGQLPDAGGQRLAGRDSHLAEIDEVRTALNQAAELLESRNGELARQRALLRVVIDSMPGGLALKTLDGRLVLINVYNAARLGRTPQALEGRSVIELGRPEYTQRMHELDQRLQKQRDGVIVDADSDRLLDDPVPHLVTKTLVRVPGHDDPLVLTITTNVTELRGLQRETENVRRLLRAVFDADDALMMLKDADGRFVMVNASFLRFWEVEESQVIGRDSLAIFGPLPGVLRSLELDRRVWAGEGPLQTEQRVARQIGSAVDDSDFVITRKLVSAPDGRTLLLVVAREVTELRRQAREIEHQRRLVREVIDLEDNYVMVKDSQHRFLLVNPAYAQANGRRVSDIVGRTLMEAFPDRAVALGIPDIDRRVMEERVTIVREERVDFGTGTGERILLADRRPIVLADGGIGVLTVIRDVTDERRREADLRRAMQQAQAAVEARSRFLANISHEVRTPINGMLGLTDLVLASPLTVQQREWLTLARAAAQGLLGIVNDVLDLSKIDAGAMSIEHTAFDLHLLLAECCRPMALRARAKGLVFSLVIAPDLPEAVMGDAARLRQVIGNLAGNAVKFTQGGTVTVRAGRVVRGSKAGRYAIAVEDTGPGIEADKQAQVFEPFVQADESTTRRFGGTGLGLAICRELATLMGGTVGLDSAPGRGSCFTVGLPLQAAPASPLPSLAGRCLAWVEDEGGSYEAWRPWLDAWGMRSIVVRHPAQAIGRRDLAVDTLVIDGVAQPAPYDAAVREWRGRGELRRLVVVHPVGAVDMLVERPGSVLPAARGLPVSRLSRPLTPRELHLALSRRLEGRAESGDGPLEAESRRLAGLHVLLAEDNDVNLLLAQTMLTRLGIDVVSVRDGAQALATLVDQRFDVVLMDIQMPELDGTDVVSQWREIESTRTHARTPIVALTAHAMAGDRERFIAAGFDGYLGKPFSMHNLVDAIESVLAHAAANSVTRP